MSLWALDFWNLAQEVEAYNTSPACAPLAPSIKSVSLQQLYAEDKQSWLIWSLGPGGLSLTFLLLAPCSFGLSCLESLGSYRALKPARWAAEERRSGNRP